MSELKTSNLESLIRAAFIAGASYADGVDAHGLESMWQMRKDDLLPAVETRAPLVRTGFTDRVISAAKREIAGKRFTTGSPLHLLEMFIKIVEDAQTPRSSPADLVDARQDVVHTDPGPVRAGASVKTE